MWVKITWNRHITQTKTRTNPDTWLKFCVVTKSCWDIDVIEKDNVYQITYYSLCSRKFFTSRDESQDVRFVRKINYTVHYCLEESNRHSPIIYITQSHHFPWDVMHSQLIAKSDPFGLTSTSDDDVDSWIWSTYFINQLSAYTKNRISLYITTSFTSLRRPLLPWVVTTSILVYNLWKASQSTRVKFDVETLTSSFTYCRRFSHPMRFLFQGVIRLVPFRPRFDCFSWSSGTNAYVLLFVVTIPHPSTRHTHRCFGSAVMTSNTDLHDHSYSYCKGQGDIDCVDALEVPWLHRIWRTGITMTLRLLI